jgi:hypothetical protein
MAEARSTASRTAGRRLFGGVQFGVIHELAEHVDGDAGVGVTLGLAVPVGTENDATDPTVHGDCP